MSDCIHQVFQEKKYHTDDVEVSKAHVSNIIQQGLKKHTVCILSKHVEDTTES